MSTRSYFEHRDTIPGLLFIIISMLTILPDLVDTLTLIDLKNLSISSGLLISFLTFFGSTTISYIVSQIWYNDLNNRFMNIFFGPLQERKIYAFLIELTIKPDDIILKTVANYFASTHKKEISDYIDRRWDLYNLLGSMLTACIFGYIIGIILLYRILHHPIITTYDKIFIILLAIFCSLLINGMVKSWEDNMEMNILGISIQLENKAINQLIPKKYLKEE